MAKIRTKKMKVQVRARQTLIFSAKLLQKSEGFTNSDLDFHWAGPVKTITLYNLP